MKKKIIILALTAVIGMSLAGCRMTDYRDAVELQDAADYRAALTLYESIGGDYKDVAERVAECQAYIDAIDAFNAAAERLSEINAELDDKMAEARSLVNSKEKALDEELRASLETAISEAKAAQVSTPQMAEELSEIISQTETMESADYDAVISNMQDKYDALDTSIRQYAQVNAPEESFVITRLKNVPHIVDISAATEDNDPNGHLGKAGGYTAQVYFSCDQIEQSEVYGDTLIEKGTEAGGSIEVYENEENAVSRNTYLAGFDGGIFASGSHTVIGTCIVRTSDELTASQQQELEAAIIDELIRLE